MCPPLRPVAPLHAVRASSRSTELGGLAEESRLCATVEPVMPEPMITTAAVEGSSVVVRCLAIEAGGVCQYDSVGSG